MKTRRVIFSTLQLSLLGMFLSLPTFADEGDYSINRWLAQQLKLHGDIEPIVRSMRAATANWDRQLNQVYHDLQPLLGPDEKATLVKSEKAWIRYRDEESKLIDLFGQDHIQDDYTAEGEGLRLKLTKDRVLQLRGYYDGMLFRRRHGSAKAGE